MPPLWPEAWRWAASCRGCPVHLPLPDRLASLLSTGLMCGKGKSAASPVPVRAVPANTAPQPGLQLLAAQLLIRSDG